VMTQIARVEALRGDFDKCLELLDEAEPLAGDDPVANIRLELERGRMFRSSGDPEAAYPLFQRAFARAPDADERYLAGDSAHIWTPDERRAMDVIDRSNRREVLGDLNPSLRVPTLVLDDGRPIAESNAILWYFGEGTRFVPEDRYERAQMFQWMFYEQYELEPALAVVRFWLAYSGRPEGLPD